jgi:hypothetical protein
VTADIPIPQRPPRRNPVWLIIAAFGALALWQATGMRTGSARNVGAGVFPLALSGIIVGLSLIAFVLPPRDRPARLDLRPFLAVTGSVVVFIALVDTAGFVPAVVLSMLTAYAGQSEGGYPGFLAYALVFAVACWALFAWALGIPFRLIGA